MEQASRRYPAPRAPRLASSVPRVGEPLPVMFLSGAVSDHALEAGYLVFDGPPAKVCGSVPVRVHTGDPIGQLCHK